MTDRIEGFNLVDEPAWNGQRSKYAPLFYACMDMPEGKCAAKVCEDDEGFKSGEYGAKSGEEKAKRDASSISSALHTCAKTDPALKRLSVHRRKNAIYIFREGGAS